MKNDKIKLAEAKNDQTRFKSNLTEIKKRKQQYQNNIKIEKNALCNIDIIHKARNKVINLFDEYSSMISEEKSKAKTGR